MWGVVEEYSEKPVNAARLLGEIVGILFLKAGEDKSNFSLQFIRPVSVQALIGFLG
jgi:hypothetical protein